jgi:hypothetical protein
MKRSGFPNASTRVQQGGHVGAVEPTKPSRSPLFSENKTWRGTGTTRRCFGWCCGRSQMKVPYLFC